MSQEGFLLITTPDAIDQVCADWVRGGGGSAAAKLCSGSVEDVLEKFENVRPVAEELTLHSGIRDWVYDGKQIFTGYFRDEDDDEEELEDVLDNPLPLYELTDAGADGLLAGSEWEKYGTKEARDAKGLKVYFFIFSY